MVRFLFLLILLLIQVEASLLTQSFNKMLVTPAVTRYTVSISRSFGVIPEDFKHHRVITIENPRDGWPYRAPIGLCLPQNETEKLLYNPCDDFYKREYKAVQEKPAIPDMKVITDPSDIIRIAKYYKDYVNALAKSFIESQKVVTQIVNHHYYTFTKEPNRMLDLVRPSNNGETSSVRERLNATLKIALNPATRYDYVLLQALFVRNKKPNLNYSFSHFEEQHFDNWKDVYQPNKAQIDAAMRFARLVYIDKPGIKAFQTEAAFNEALLEIDPSFKEIHG